MLTSIKRKVFPVLGLAALMAMASCSDDGNDVTPSYEIPATYNFENVNYAGQTARLGMLTELSNYIKTGNEGAVLDASKMKAMYANANAPFSSADLNNAGKQLKDKTIATAQAQFEGYFDAVAQASQSAGAAASDGTAGILTSADGARKYLVDANGVVLDQFIKKGLMGAVLYFQAVDHYLTEEGIGAAVDNKTVTPGEGTAMQHHWDEAFGYFGAPKDFPANTADAQYWAGYSAEVDAALGSNKTMMDAFLKGRAAINANDTKAKEAAAATLRTEWERLAVAAAILELKDARENVADQAKKSQKLSEAKGFVMGLKYKTDRKITDAQYEQAMVKIGTNFYNTTADDIAAAIDILSAAYNMDSIKGQL
ncbi:DUF4856 domain-containing protein [Pontibacter sp. 172403-2]|uniref:DUF4856 domain-containing protein n=1 Tax=Pontibacter rufus TaxID=2791028 RepID=UPI0018AF92FB|nr:DUF4856 domain-containing protein [Pontibacter sp. 172403-2]MBF9252148.1 DUF4856 domain-containing protein [Pontibacter sp. 172403-2]